MDNFKTKMLNHNKKNLKKKNKKKEKTCNAKIRVQRIQSYNKNSVSLKVNFN